MTQDYDILNPEGRQICNIGSEVTVIMTKGLILPIGGVASGRVCEQPCFSLLSIYCFFFYCLLISIAGQF